MVENLEELTALAKALNLKSDQVNEMITSINRRLVQLNFGLEVWYEKDFVLKGDYIHRTRQKNMPAVRYYQAVLLGYVRFERGWQLGLKSILISEYLDPKSGWEIADVELVHAPTPLLKASRDHRIKAMGLIDGLLEQIKTEAEIMIRDANGASKAVSKL
jgi:hypothetical protein